MIFQEGPPGLGWRLSAADHVLAHAGFPDIDAQLPQFAVDAGCTPQRIVAAHRADQVTDLGGNGRSARLAAADLPGPEELKSFAVPGNHGLGFYDRERRPPAAPHPGERHPEEAVRHRQLRPFGAALQDSDLMAESDVLKLQGCTGFEQRREGRARHPNRRECLLAETAEGMQLP